MSAADALPGDEGLTRAELAGFARAGFAGPFTALSPDALAEPHAVLTRALRDPSRVYGFPTTRDHHLGYRTLYAIASHPSVVARVASLLGPDVLLWRSTIFRKLPGARRVIWHQEHDFRGHRGTPALDPPQNITAWFAITRATRENGCVQILPASQHALLASRTVPKGTGIFGRDFVFENLPDSTPIPMEVEPGQFFLFNERLVHGSDPNRSASERSGISIRFTATRTRIHAGLRVDGQGLPLRHWHAILVHGRDAFGHNKLGPPPAGDPAPSGRLATALGALRHRWLQVRHATR